MIAGCLGMFLLLIAMIVGAASYGIYQVAQIANQRSEQQQAVQEALQAELAEQSSTWPGRFQGIIAAFSADEPGVPEQELAALQAFFDKVYEQREVTAESGDLTELLDFDTFTNRVLAWPEGTSLNYLERQAAIKDFRDSKLLSWLNAPFTIVHVSKQSDGQSAIVSGYAGLQAGASMEQRWLLVAHGNGWRVADAEICDWGCWRSQLHARHLQAAYRSPLDWDRFEAAIERIRSANELIEAGKMDEAAKELEQVEYSSIDSTLQDEVRMRLLQSMTSMGVPEKRLEVAQQFQRPEQWPGARFAIAQANADLGRHQEAIEAGRKYMAQVGPTLTINQVLLPCYEAAADGASQAEAYRHVLRVLHDDASALAGLAKLAGDDAAETIQRLQKTSDPPKTAAEVVQYLNIDEHAAAINGLIAFLEREAPHSLALLETKAQRAYQDEEYEVSAGLYLDAWQANRKGEAASRLCASYFAAMIAAEQLDAALDRAPDVQAALHFLAGDYFYGGDHGIEQEHVRAALKKYQAEQGEDKNVLAYEGKLLLDEKRYADAEAKLSAALQQLPKSESETDGSESELDRSDLVSSLAAALLAQDRVEQAFETSASEQENAGWILLSQLDLSQPSQRDQARKLIALERARAPASPWSGVMEATLLEAEQKPAEAWAALPKTAADVNYIQIWIRNLAARLLVKGAAPLEQYTAISPAEEFFVDLAHHLKDEKDWDRLAQLIQLQQRARPDDPNLLGWQAELLYQRGQHDAVAQLLLPQGAQLLEKRHFDYARDGNPTDRLLRSLILLQRYDEALALVQQGRQLSNPALWQARVHLARGDVEQAVDILDSAADRSQHQLYNDPDFGHLARAPAALPLRRQVPPRFPAPTTWRRAELLLSQGVAWDAASLTSLARHALGSDASATELKDLHTPAGSSAWKITTGSQTLLVFAGLRSDDVDEEARTIPDNAQLARAVEEHRAWIAIVPSGEVTEAELPETVYKLTAALAGENCLAVRLSDLHRAFVYDAQLQETLKATDATKQLEQRGEQLAGWFVPEPEMLRDPQRVRARQWLAFARRMAEQPPPDNPRVCVRVQVCGCWEDVWLSVERLDSAPNRYAQFVATVEQPSLLVPELQPGEPYFLATSELHDFQYTQDGVTTRGRE